MRRISTLAFLALALAGASGCAGKGPWSYSPSPENLRNRDWFRDAKFGVMFNWSPGDPSGDEALAANKKGEGAWIALARGAGAGYVVCPSRDPAGNLLYDSAHGDRDIVGRAKLKRDPLKEAAAESRRLGLRLFVSHAHPAPDAGEAWDKLLDDRDAELAEIFNHYGQLGGARLEGMRASPDADWRLEKLYRRLHRIQPAALIGSNHGGKPFDGEDYQIHERQIDEAARDAGLPSEICESINDSWGFNPSDRAFKTLRALIQSLVRAAGADANFLLAVAPRPDGSVPPEASERLAEIGRWLEANGESVYRTRGGPLAPADWGVTVRRDDKIYLHYLPEKAGTILFPFSAGEVGQAYFFSTGEAAHFKAEGESYEIEVPTRALRPIDTILVLEMRLHAAEPGAGK